MSHPEDYAFPLDDAGEPVLNRIKFPAVALPPVPGGVRQSAHPRRRRTSCTVTLLVPFDESIVLKLPHRGAGFRLAPGWVNFKTGAAAERGHNFGIYLTAVGTVANGALHVLPGSHRRGILDLKDAMAAQHGFALPGSR